MKSDIALIRMGFMLGFGGLIGLGAAWGTMDTLFKALDFIHSLF